MPRLHRSHVRGTHLSALPRSSDSNDSAPSAGLLAGVICGSLIAGILLTLGLWLLWRMRMAHRQQNKGSNTTEPKGLGIFIEVNNATESQQQPATQHTLPDLNFGTPSLVHHPQTNTPEAVHPATYAVQEKAKSPLMSPISPLSPTAVTPPNRTRSILGKRKASSQRCSQRHSAVSPPSISAPFNVVHTPLGQYFNQQHPFLKVTGSNQSADPQTQPPPKASSLPHIETKYYNANNYATPTKQIKTKDTQNNTTPNQISNISQSQPNLYTPSVYHPDSQPPPSLPSYRTIAPPSRAQEYSLASLTTNASLAAKYANAVHVSGGEIEGDNNSNMGTLENVHCGKGKGEGMRGDAPWEYLSAEEALDGGWRNSVTEGDGKSGVGRTGEGTWL